MHYKKHILHLNATGRLVVIRISARVGTPCIDSCFSYGALHNQKKLMKHRPCT